MIEPWISFAGKLSVIPHESKEKMNANKNKLVLLAHVLCLVQTAVIGEGMFSRKVQKYRLQSSFNFFDN